MFPFSLFASPPLSLKSDAIAILHPSTAIRFASTASCDVISFPVVLRDFDFFVNEIVLSLLLLLLLAFGLCSGGIVVKEALMV